MHAPGSGHEREPRAGGCAGFGSVEGNGVAAGDRPSPLPRLRGGPTLVCIMSWPVALTAQVGNAPLNAIVFGAYGHMARTIRGLTGVDDPLSYPTIAACAMWAGFLQVSVATPVELVKCKLQADGGSVYRGPVDCVRKVCGVSACQCVRASVCGSTCAGHGLRWFVPTACCGACTGATPPPSFETCPAS